MSSPVPARFRAFLGGDVARPNPFGLGSGLSGLVIGWLCSAVALNLSARFAVQHHVASHFIQNIVDLSGLWVGLVGAALAARAFSRTVPDGLNESAPGEGVVVRDAQQRPTSTLRGYLSQLRSDFGISLRLIDIPVGIVVGLVGQYLLTPLLELPLLPFIPDLYTRLNTPATSLTAGITGVQFAILGLFICLGSPLVEELYFRGLVLRALLGRLGAQSGVRGAPLRPVVLAIVIDGIFFGLVHFEPLELLALAGFGMVLALLSWGSGRLGPSLIAHITFNSVTFIALARTH